MFGVRLARGVVSSYVIAMLLYTPAFTFPVGHHELHNRQAWKQHHQNRLSAARISSRIWCWASSFEWEFHIPIQRTQCRCFLDLLLCQWKTPIIKENLQLTVELTRRADLCKTHSTTRPPTDAKRTPIQARRRRGRVQRRVSWRLMYSRIPSPRYYSDQIHD
jgi:hypothetical protein